MSSHSKAVLCLTLASLSSIGYSQTTAETAAKPASRTFIGPLVVLPIAPSPEQMPAAAPDVVFHRGELTIVARNSSLGAILREVQRKTGAAVDMPTTPTERVVGQFGPGPAREVLASLLNGSHFNYLLLGSPQNPNGLDRIVLLNKSSTVENASVAPQSPTPGRGMPRQITMPGGNESDDMASDPPAEDMADQPDPTPEDQAALGEDPQNVQPAVKTPQQLLQELQRQQQQQAAQQPGQQQTAAPAPQTLIQQR